MNICLWLVEKDDCDRYLFEEDIGGCIKGFGGWGFYGIVYDYC